ncbi:MAG TPA: hypothetical protein VFS21_27965 [Roseiflexaceae bacterium]|nr:hypothetical protein [Roseiflexaceae bacterium]
MTKFVLLYNGGSEPAGEAEMAAEIQEWHAWYGQLGSAVVDDGNPFSAVARRIDSDGSVGDVPAVQANGYTIISAESLDEAVEKAKSCPVLKSGGQISVYETFNIG